MSKGRSCGPDRDGGADQPSDELSAAVITGCVGRAQTVRARRGRPWPVRLSSWPESRGRAVSLSRTEDHHGGGDDEQRQHDPPNNPRRHPQRRRPTTARSSRAAADTIKLLWLTIRDIEDKRARARAKEKGLPANNRPAAPDSSRARSSMAGDPPSDPWPWPTPNASTTT